jgi:hypothetical protein
MLQDVDELSQGVHVSQLHKARMAMALANKNKNQSNHANNAPHAAGCR